MAVSDYITRTPKLRALITTVDPSQRLIECMTADNYPRRLFVSDIPTTFVWPREGEQWSIVQENGYWVLGRRYLNDDEDADFRSLSPGEGLDALNSSTFSVPVLEPGIPGQNSVGRNLTISDFTNLLGVNEPIGLWKMNGNALDSSSNGHHLGITTNAGTNPSYGTGITGAANEASRYAVPGSTPRTFGLADASWQMPRTLTAGGWMRHATTANNAVCIGKENGWKIGINGGGILYCAASITGSGWINNSSAAFGATPLADDRWHFFTIVIDGTSLVGYVDGRPEINYPITAPLVGSTNPFCVGGYISGTMATQPSELPTGGISNAFLLDEPLNEDQIRLLMCASIPHNMPSVPSVSMSITRRRRKGVYASSDFPVAPLRLYNMSGAATSTQKRQNDGNTLHSAYTLTEAGTPLDVAGTDGSRQGAYRFNGTSQYLTAVDTSLPTNQAQRSYGIWVQGVTTAATQFILSQGTASNRAIQIFFVASTGQVALTEGTDSVPVGITTGGYTDGRWHFVVVTMDGADTWTTRKIYVDGRLAAFSSSALTTAYATTPLTIAARAGTNDSFMTGNIANVFVCDYVLTGDQIAKLYHVGARALPVSPVDPGSYVEAVDDTNIYALQNAIPGVDQVNYKVGI